MIATITGWTAIVCLVLTGILEPQQPKKDGRFRTGYKNNATVAKKSPEAKRAQKFLVILGAISGAIWYLSQ